MDVNNGRSLYDDNNQAAGQLNFDEDKEENKDKVQVSYVCGGNILINHRYSKLFNQIPCRMWKRE